MKTMICAAARTALAAALVPAVLVPAVLVPAAGAAAATLKAVPARLDPAKAYVLVEYELRKNPFADLPGSRKTMPLQAGMLLARYDAALGDIRGMGKAAKKPLPGGQRAHEIFRNKPIAKGERSRLFLLEMEPDLWVVQGYGKTSFSLGSYSFELAPGTVTDLGVVSADDDWAEGQKPTDGGDVLKAAFLGPFAKRPDVAPARLSFRPRTAADLPLPAGIAADAVRAVSFGTDARFGNHLGGLVNRIDGVNARLKAPAAADPAR